jgi:aryl-alcohol dehydrogenase-like predicted oxidoreductase
MEYRNLGASGLKVSLVGLGCNNFGQRMDAERAQSVIHTAIDLGITLFDTADVYGGRGGSETVLGQHLGDRRKDIVLATKFGIAMDDTGHLRGGSRRYIMSAVEASLKRLRTDWIDLYQYHRDDLTTPVDETLRALDDLVRQGKVRYIGCSNTPVWRMVDMQWTTRELGLNPMISCQLEYSLLWRGVERDFVPAMKSHGLGLLPYYPLACGLLAGNYQRGTPLRPDGRITKSAAHVERFLTPENFDIVEQLEAFARERGRTLLQLSMSWLAAQPVVPSIIAGVSRPEQLASNIDAVSWKLSAEELARIDALTASRV